MQPAAAASGARSNNNSSNSIIKQQQAALLAAELGLKAPTAARKQRKARRGEGGADALLVPHAPPGVGAAAAVQADTAVTLAAGAFAPAARFQGARPGMVFKLGARGLGYYADDGGMQRRQQQEGPPVKKLKHLQEPRAQQKKQQKQQKQQPVARTTGLPPLPGLARKRSAVIDPPLHDDDDGHAGAFSPSGGGGSGAASSGDGDGGGESDDAGHMSRGLSARLVGSSSGGKRRKAMPGRLRKKLAKQRERTAGK